MDDDEMEAAWASFYGHLPSDVEPAEETEDERKARIWRLLQEAAKQ